MSPPLTSFISRATLVVALCVGSSAVAQAPAGQPDNNASASAATSSAASRAPMQISLIEDALAHAPSVSNHTSLEASVGVTGSWQLSAAIAAHTVIRGNAPTTQFENFAIGAQRVWSSRDGSLQTTVGVEFEVPLVAEDDAAPVWSPTFSAQKQIAKLRSLTLAADGKYAFDFPRKSLQQQVSVSDGGGKPFEVHASALLPFRALSLTTEVSYLPDGLLEAARGAYVAPGVVIPVNAAFQVGMSISQHISAPRTRSLGFQMSYQF